MNKRGQLTVFIVVAIVIVAGLLIYLSVRPGFKVSVDPEVVPIYNFVQNCVEQSSEDAVYHIGQYGGYYVAPEESTNESFPYYYDNKQSLILSKVEMERELSKTVNDLLFFCLRNFQDFPSHEVNLGLIESNVVVESDRVSFSINIPLSITKGESAFNFNDFGTEIDSRLEVIHFVASEIVKQQLRNEDICISCLSEIGFENQIYITMEDHPRDEQVVIFILIDEKEKINGDDFRYYFAHRFEDGNKLE